MIKYIDKIGKVTDNNDPDKLGRIQVLVIPELQDISESDLPWAKPIYNSTNGTPTDELRYHNIPDVGSYVRLKISEDWTSFYYSQESLYFSSLYDYEDLYSQISDVIEDIGDNEYPQPQMQKDTDGFIQFHNTETGERGFIFPSGTALHIIDSTINLIGENGLKTIIDTSSNLITIESDSSTIEFDMDNNKIKFTDIEQVDIGSSADVLTLFSPLKEILEKLLDHNHVAPTGPTLPAQESSGTPLSAQKSKLNDMKSIVNSD